MSKYWRIPAAWCLYYIGHWISLVETPLQRFLGSAYQWCMLTSSDLDKEEYIWKTDNDDTKTSDP